MHQLENITQAGNRADIPLLILNIVLDHLNLPLEQVALMVELQLLMLQLNILHNGNRMRNRPIAA